MRLIDADIMMELVGRLPFRNNEDIKNFIEVQPTVEAVPTDFHDKCQQIEIHKRLKLEEELKDAEPIVHCKDCKFYEISELQKDYTDDKRYKPSVCVKGYYAKPRKGNWYCADGVRRDEVTE